jgi:hypothetical protein
MTMRRRSTNHHNDDFKNFKEEKESHKDKVSSKALRKDNTMKVLPTHKL